MRWFRFAVGAALCGLVACSSGGSDDGDASASTAGDYETGRRAECQGLCDGYRRCGFADSACDDGCLSDFHPLGARGNFLAAVGKCLRDEDCDTLLTDDPSSACVDEVSAAEPLREAVVNYCESAGRNYFRCNIWLSLEDCANRVGAWEDDVLRAATMCLPKACDEQTSCEQAVFHPEP